MNVNISISTTGTPDDVAEYLRHVATAIEAGEQHGKAGESSWEIDDYADEAVDPWA